MNPGSNGQIFFFGGGGGCIHSHVVLRLWVFFFWFVCSLTWTSSSSWSSTSKSRWQRQHGVIILSLKKRLCRQQQRQVKGREQSIAEPQPRQKGLKWDQYYLDKWSLNKIHELLNRKWLNVVFNSYRRLIFRASQEAVSHLACNQQVFHHCGFETCS